MKQPPPIYFKGTRPLIIPAVVYILLVALVDLHKSDKTLSGAAIWPILLSGGAFLYLWWLAILLFDLVIAWQRYIRYAVADITLNSLHHRCRADEPTKEKEDAAASESTPSSDPRTTD